MRLIFTLLVFVGISLAGCEKYNLKQPAHLTFSWKLKNNPSPYQPSIESGYFFGTALHLTGDREEGSDIAIDQSLPPVEVTFSMESPSIGVKMDVPMGKYSVFNIALDLDSEEATKVGLEGHTTVLGENVILCVEWKNMTQLVFKSGQTLDFKKKDDYALELTLDVQELLEGISQDVWDDAYVTLEVNGPTVVVNDDLNHVLFTAINANISEALQINQK